MKIFSLLFFLTIGNFLHAQVTDTNFEISDQGVSRKEIRTIDGAIIKIQRNNENKKLHNGDINLIKMDNQGKIIWSKFYGGMGYEYVGSIGKAKDGTLMIIGTTSSMGNGNNDILLIKTDIEGNELWKKTYGGFFNEYGKYVKELPNGNLLVKGQQQICKGENVGNCYDQEWSFEVDALGNEIN